MLREEYEEDLHFTITRWYICYTDSEPNRSIVRIAVERNFFKKTTWLLLHLLSACHNLGDGMPYDNTSLLGLLL